jgi:DNA polymerase I-like protein with 3'-5' exonuclease and polymerase domains
MSESNGIAKDGEFASTLEAAADYRRRGWKVVLVAAGDKRPFQEGWQAREVEEEVLADHCRAGGSIGLQTGLVSEVLDVDLDADEARLAAPHVLPATGLISGRPGAERSHWFYRSLAQQARVLYKDVGGAMLLELRGEGCQSVAPPSLYPGGGRYAWAAYGEPASVDLIPLRQRVAELAVAVLCSRHWPTDEGRHEAHKHLAGALAHAGYDPEGAERIARGVVAATGDEEGNDRLRVVRDTFKSNDDGKKVTGWPSLAAVVGEQVVARIRRWLGLDRGAGRVAGKAAAAKKVRAVPPYQPFPVEALPAPIAEYVRQGAVALGCDPAYLALPALAAGASVIGNTRTIRLKRGWDEPAIIWAAIVGDSGTLKSPAYLKAVGYLFRLQKGLLQEFKQKVAHYKEDLQAYKEAKKAAREGGGGPGEAPEAPVLGRVVCNDTTIEKLAEILEDNPRGTLLARDELAGWLGSFTRYKGQKGGSDLPNWLEMFRAGTVIVDRKTAERKTLFVHRAAVSVTGGIQPGVLAHALTPEFLDAGLAARLLMALPPKLPKRWTEAEVDLQTEQAYQDVLDDLLDLDFDTREGEQRPHVLHLSAEAKALWVSFYGEWAQEQAGVEGEVAAAFSKLEGYTARFALVHHVVTRVARGEDDLVPVGEGSVEAGVKLCRWFAGEARRIYALLSESHEERDARRLVEFIRSRGGRITVKQLQRSNQRRYSSSEDAEAALEALVRGEMGRWEDRPHSGRGGRPTRDFVLCVTYDETDETPDDGDDGGGSPGDETPDAPAGTASGPADFQAGDEVSSVSSYVTQEGETQEGPSEAANNPREVSSPGREVSSHALDYLLVNRPENLSMVLAAIDNTRRIALDTETTGLSWCSDRARLLSLGCTTADGGTFAYLLDVAALPARSLAPVWEALREKELVGHNLAFDLGFLSRLGFEPGGAALHDVMILSRLLTSGGRDGNSLADLTQRFLGFRLDKAEQTGDWAAPPLSDSQLSYAAADVLHLDDLLDRLTAEIDKAGLTRTAAIERRCLPAWHWMATAGLTMDRSAWEELARRSRAERDRLREEMHRLAPEKPVEPPGKGAGWNFDSTPQVKALLHQLGFGVDDTKDETLAGIDHPLVNLLRQYRFAKWLDGTYGESFLRFLDPDGRVYAGWVQTGNEAGRSSCKEPNLQQVPRQAEYRRAFVAPPGKVLVKADFAAAHLRIACRIAREKKMLAAFQENKDLHRLTAASLLGKPEAEVTRQDRQLAKAVAFGLLYGMGAKTLRIYALQNYGVPMTLDEARRHKARFFKTYPGLARWHRETDAARERQTETRSLAGRRRLIDPKTPIMHRLNSPVLGTEADAAKTALALLWERRGACPGARPVAFVHDEILVEAGADQAEAAQAWVKAAMMDAMAPLIAPVPVEVEVKVGRTWGGD